MPSSSELNARIDGHLTTTDGFAFRVLATDLEGPLPVAIHVNGEIARLTADLKCPANEGYSLASRRVVNVRFLNFYRAADGSFTPGSKTYASNSDRLSMRDTSRAIFGLRVEFDETTGAVTCEKV